MPGFAFVSSYKSFFGYVPAYWFNIQLFSPLFLLMRPVLLLLYLGNAGLVSYYKCG